MAERKKNNNLLYGTLLIVCLLLLLIPFFIFHPGSAVHGTSHLARFGWHILAFVSALFAGSLVSTGVVNVTASAATAKVAVWAGVAIVGTAVVYNTTTYTHKNLTTQTLVQLSDSISATTNPLIEDTLLTDSEKVIPVEEGLDTIPVKIAETSVPATSEGKEDVTETPLPRKEPTTLNENTDKNSSATILSETCNSFRILHGNKQLDRKTGLSIYDPNKTIRFSNDCGCVLKEATLNLSRGNNLLEQKIQNGNFINFYSYKDLQAGDRLTVEITKANCKNSTGNFFVYIFPKPILTIVQISDSRDFETTPASGTNQKKTGTTIDNSIKTSQKDIVEEELTKYGN